MNNPKQHLLVVDDEEDLCEILSFNLSNEGFNVDTANSAEEALEILKDNSKKYSLILLDVMMDKLSGFQMAKIMRKDMNIHTPVIFLTAKDNENDMLTGFSLGADDYISKPFSIKEVVARVKAVLRRSAVEVEQEEVITLDELTIHITTKNVLCAGVAIPLTRKEYDILLLLAKNTDKTFPRTDILDKVWGDDLIVAERTVDVHIARLRKKLGDFGNNITNRSNYGYKLSI